MRTRIFSTFVVMVALLSIALPVQAQVYEPGEVIVRLRGTSKSTSSQAFVGKVAMSKSMKLSKSWNSLNMHHFKSSAGHSTQQLIEMYKSDPAVAYVEPNYIFNKLDVENPDLSDLDFDAMSTNYAQSSAPIAAEASWGLLSPTGNRPIVAVIDSGVDYTHCAFTNTGAIWSNTDEIDGNGIDDDGNGYVDDVRGWNFVSNSKDPMDDNGHGTHVAGTVLGVGQDIVPSNPAAPCVNSWTSSRVKIMPLKTLSSTGSGTTSSAVSAIYYAINNGAHIINNSWGGTSYSAALHEAMVYAYNTGAFVASAAGNAASNNDSVPMFPASYDVPSNASIAATSSSDAMAYYSNFGNSSVHVGSPGTIYSTVPGNGYSTSQGTSMATPVVAGIAALIKWEQPSMNGYQIKNIIFGQGNVLGALSGKTTTSRRVNVYGALINGKNAAVEAGQPYYDISASSFGRELAGALDSSVGGCGTISALRGGGSGGFPLASLLILLPLVVFAVMRWRSLSSPDNNRVHDRFLIDTDVKMSVGGKQLLGKVNSISQGGVRINADELIEKGSVVTMTISAPDGTENVQVQGHIVWSEENSQAVGVKFGVDQLAQATVAGWTRNLKKEPDN